MDIINKLKNEMIPQEFSMMWFDVKFLLTSVLLWKIIDITLERIYHQKEI